MIKLTASAAARLEKLIAEHPEDPIVRLALTDLDEARLALTITLDDHTHEGDDVQRVEGLTVAVEDRSAARMDNVTIDFEDGRGFRILHPPPHDPGELRVSHVN